MEIGDWKLEIEDYLSLDLAVFILAVKMRYISSTSIHHIDFLKSTQNHKEP